MIQADRSRYIEHQRCPRSRWYRYEIYGTGIEPAHANKHLAIGKAVHAGLAGLLRGDSAAQVDDLVHAELPADFPPDLRALSLALVNGWRIVRLTDFLQTYEVLEVEQERAYERDGVTLLGRSDGLLKHRETGDLHVLSFKTAGSYDQRTEIQGYHDDQHLSEAWLYRGWPEGEPSFVHMEYLIKGYEKKQDEAGGLAEWQSPLIRGWQNETIIGGAYAARYNWTDEDGKKHRLGKGWVPYAAYEHGLDHWLEWLEENDPQALAAQYVVPADYTILDQDMQDWWEQFAQQSRLVHLNAGSVEANRSNADYRTLLNLHFPQHRRSCDWPSACPFQEICFGPVSERDPLSSPGYARRTPNHPAEQPKDGAYASK